jgi:hypothetical protein
VKIWFDYCGLKGYMDDDSHVKLGIGWYGHSPDHKWRGFTIQFYLYRWLVNFTFVDNWKEYDKRINYRWDPDHIKKLGERLKAKRDARNKK